MKLHKSIFILFFAIALCFIPFKNVFAGAKGSGAFITIAETDGFETNSHLFYFFDLRDRETFIQLTYTDPTNTGTSATAHIQIWDVSNNCNENNFFDVYTVNDTHVYNMRDIQTNDGNPAGVVLPEGAYGIVTAIVTSGDGSAGRPIGNFRIIDDNGYEYRTNAQKIGETHVDDFEPGIPEVFHSFNFNTKGGVALSDVVGITFTFFNPPGPGFEVTLTPVQDIFDPFDVDIVNENETLFSCRDIVFSCVDEDNPLLEELLENSGASVASFEYGINNAIPHSKGGELLCPGNTISEGTVILRPEAVPEFGVCSDCSEPLWFFGFVGLNTGNGRASLDSFWVTNDRFGPLD